MIETARLLLRPPVPGDRAALHAMWADPVVMADLGRTKSAEESDEAIARHEGYRLGGLGFWVVERREDGAAIGFCGLKPGNADTPIAGELEAGWMLAQAWWRRGYAEEAMRASLGWAWANRAEPRICAITAARNSKSRALMAKLGMAHCPELDFDHSQFEPGDPLRASVVYAIGRPV
jgi:RimJ/RimL family protein N-acetyltransferase